MLTIGTSYFFSKPAAIRYYRAYYRYDYPDTAAAVEQKLAEGEIHIGKPPVKRSRGERIKLIDEGTRYAIVAPDRF